MICFLWGLGISGLGRLGFSGFTGYYMGDSVGHVWGVLGPRLITHGKRNGT